MKHSFLLLAAALAALPATSAPTTSTGTNFQPKHNHVEIDGYGSTVELFLYYGPQKVAKVISVAVAHNSDGTESAYYEVTIEKLAATNRPLSLFTLGIQGRRWDVHIMKIVEGNNVVLIDPDGKKAWTGSTGDGPSPLPIPRTGERIFSDIAKDEKVWFLNFEGSRCVLQVRSERKNHGRPGRVNPTDSPQDKSMHDTFPRTGLPGAYN